MAASLPHLPRSLTTNKMASVLKKMNLLPREKLVGLLLLGVGIVELEALRRDFGQGSDVIK